MMVAQYFDGTQSAHVGICDFFIALYSVVIPSLKFPVQNYKLKRKRTKCGYYVYTDKTVHLKNSCVSLLQNEDNLGNLHTLSRCVLLNLFCIVFRIDLVENVLFRQIPVHSQVSIE